jgi:hypothetical protein
MDAGRLPQQFRRKGGDAGKAGRNITDLGRPSQMGIKIFYLYP